MKKKDCLKSCSEENGDSNDHLIPTNINGKKELAIPRKDGGTFSIVPYSKNWRDFFALIYMETSITAFKMHCLTGVPNTTIKRWWKAIDIPKHREIQVDGGRFYSPIKRMVMKIAELEKELERAKLNAAAAEAYLDPSSILGLLVGQMKNKLSGARLGELAQASKAILEVEKAQKTRKSTLNVVKPKWLDEFMNKLGEIKSKCNSSDPDIMDEIDSLQQKMSSGITDNNLFSLNISEIDLPTYFLTFGTA